MGKAALGLLGAIGMMAFMGGGNKAPPVQQAPAPPPPPTPEPDIEPESVGGRERARARSLARDQDQQSQQLINLNQEDSSKTEIAKKTLLGSST